MSPLKLCVATPCGGALNSKQNYIIKNLYVRLDGEKRKSQFAALTKGAERN